MFLYTLCTAERHTFSIKRHTQLQTFTSAAKSDLMTSQGAVCLSSGHVRIWSENKVAHYVKPIY